MNEMDVLQVRKPILVLGAFIRLGRPIFLVGGFVLYGLGAAVAAYRGYRMDWARFAWGQLAVTATQLMTHYSNDYFDLEADRANATPTQWSGGSRVLPNRELPPRVALVAAVTLAAIALVANIVLETKLASGLVATGLMLLALVLSWEYSAPPLRFHSRGVGEVIAMIIVTLLVPLIGFTVQTRGLEPIAFVAAAPLCFVQFAMLLAVEFPDAAGDAVVGKRTLVVRLGASGAGILYVAALVLAYALLPVWSRLGLPREAALVLAATFPAAAWLVRGIARGEHRQVRYWSRLAFVSAALVTVSAILELGVFVELASHNP
jgi:1,4-dihydroxy-2-naphthoate octaprenyltransferase